MKNFSGIIIKSDLIARKEDNVSAVPGKSFSNIAGDVHTFNLLFNKCTKDLQRSIAGAHVQRVQ